MNKNFYQKTGFLILILSTTLLSASGGSKILNELVKAFPIIAAIAFIWVGWKALNEYNETKDVLSSLKIVGWYLLAVFFIIGGYQVVKNVSL